MASELTDEDRATAIEHAQHLLRELERQHRTGHDSLRRFHRERVDALLLLEMDAELRARRAREKALVEAATEYLDAGEDFDVLDSCDDNDPELMAAGARVIEAHAKLRTILEAK